ncbi:MAG: cytochrome P450, partial [Sphingomonadales bacterium]
MIDGANGSMQDDRKSAGLAAERTQHQRSRRRVTLAAEARGVLRDPALLQAGPGADRIKPRQAEHIPVFHLDGEAHRKRRAAIARLFTPKAIAGRYRTVMEEVTDELLAKLVEAGTGRLDAISFDLAIIVAADIIGLTATDPTRMARRLSTLLDLSFAEVGGGLGFLLKMRRNWHGFRFFMKDVKPAIKARRAAPRDDVISQTLERGYADQDILVECMTYAAAGMLTTREFIVMVAWHLFDRPDLRERFVAGPEKVQFAILREILRLEPVATFLYRRQPGGSADAECPELLVDLRAANLDEAVVGGCPYAVDPERAVREGENGDYL